MNQIIRDTRFLMAIVGAGAVSFALFLFMHQLIGTNPQVLQAPPTINPINIVKVQKQERVVPPHPIHRKPPVAHKQPKTINNPSPTHTKIVRTPLKLTNGPNDNGPIIDGRRQAPAVIGNGDSMLGVAFRFNPQYPPQAAMQGVEGYVKTCFAVAADGSVVGPRVVGASSPQARELLGQAALQTILRWKFFPRQLDGRAVATPNVCQDIRFTLH